MKGFLLPFVVLGVKPTALSMVRAPLGKEARGSQGHLAVPGTGPCSGPAEPMRWHNRPHGGSCRGAGGLDRKQPAVLSGNLTPRSLGATTCPRVHRPLACTCPLLPPPSRAGATVHGLTVLSQVSRVGSGWAAWTRPVLASSQPLPREPFGKHENHV